MHSMIETLPTEEPLTDRKVHNKEIETRFAEEALRFDPTIDEMLGDLQRGDEEAATSKIRALDRSIVCKVGMRVGIRAVREIQASYGIRMLNLQAMASGYGDVTKDAEIKRESNQRHLKRLEALFDRDYDRREAGVSEE
jgi:hypothetical protein